MKNFYIEIETPTRKNPVRVSANAGFKLKVCTKEHGESIPRLIVEGFKDDEEYPTLHFNQIGPWKTV